MRKVRLAWKGPFELQQLARGFEDARDRPGVYLWTLTIDDRSEIAYIGQAADLAVRMQQHIFYTLGGGYCLYDPADLRAGQVTAFTENARYKPGLDDSMEKLLGDLPELQEMARKNLESYRYFWAEVSAWSGDATLDRQLVESALISRARDKSRCLQNARVSVASRNDERLEVSSRFDAGSVRALQDVVAY